MNIPIDFITEPNLFLNALGGETLSESGFENEIPEPEFVIHEDEPEATGV